MAPIRLQTLLSLPPSLRTAAAKRVLQPATSALQHPPSPTCGFRHQSTAAHPSLEPSASSVSQTEVSHFNQLASSWWDPQGSSRLLHLMNPLRHDFIQRCLQAEARNPNRKLHYLDIGCGGGIFAESAARKTHTASVTAIDPTPEVIGVARKHQRQDPLLLEPGRLEYKNIALEDLLGRDGGKGGYDIITLFEVIEHVQQPTPFLERCLTHLKPGGWLIGSTIARTNTSWFTTKLMAEDVLRLVPRGTHDWAQYIQPQELREWARVQREVEFDGRPGSERSGAGWEVMGVVYVPGFGWREVEGSEAWGNYFFGVRKKDVAE